MGLFYSVGRPVERLNSLFFPYLLDGRLGSNWDPSLFSALMLVGRSSDRLTSSAEYLGRPGGRPRLLSDLLLNLALLLCLPTSEFVHALHEFSGNNDIAFDPLLLYVVNIVSFFLL